MTIKPILTACAAALALAACSDVEMPDVAQLVEPEVTATRSAPPPGLDPAGCYAQDVTPALVETVTEQVMLQPASVSTDGKVYYPAVYKTETRQAIVRERKELWFEVPCADLQTPEFVASLQRALEARDLYRGPITGEMTARTRRAVRAFQKPQGLNSGILSIAAARQLGLVRHPGIPEGWERVKMN
ncbi:MAG: peptidoglycan-binding domain-containing protein [Rhodobacter sp.]|nr:peptidoglycan-binding domain-containing protein [Rhodobacter sp.]